MSYSRNLGLTRPDPRNLGVTWPNPRSEGLAGVSGPSYLGLEGDVIPNEHESYYYNCCCYIIIIIISIIIKFF
jgi:hypothetical protein